MNSCDDALGQSRHETMWLWLFCFIWSSYNSFTLIDSIICIKSTLAHMILCELNRWWRTRQAKSSEKSCVGWWAAKITFSPAAWLWLSTSSSQLNWQTKSETRTTEMILKSQSVGINSAVWAIIWSEEQFITAGKTWNNEMMNNKI